jgi:hypothetical protein
MCLECGLALGLLWIAWTAREARWLDRMMRNLSVLNRLARLRGFKMSRHNEMPPIPPANRSKKGTGDDTEVSKDTSKGHSDVQNTAEQGDTANIKQNTTNAGFFKGRRVK